MSRDLAGQNVSIMGAGLCGSLLSIFLARRGASVTVFERREDMRQKPVEPGRSINLALAARGLGPLRQAGLEERIGALLIPMRGRMIHEPDLAPVLQPYGQRPGELIYSISRNGLNTLLMDEAEQRHGVRFQFGHACTGYDTANRSAMVRAADGTSLQVRGQVFGCDGAGSPLRQSLVAGGGLAERVDMLDHGYKELNIPPAGRGIHRIHREALHIWPRGEFMLIALPNLDGSFTVTLFLPREGEESFARLQQAENVRAFFHRHFPSAAELIPDLAEQFLQNPTGELGTVRCYPWQWGGKVTLLGDAAHAVVPFHGQGMNCAFEDCLVMDRLIEEHGGDWDTVLDAFQKQRKPNADAIADMALENYVEMRERVRDPAFLLKKQIAFKLEQLLPEHFIPRYSMVMFHDEIGYAEAMQRGQVQARLLSELAEGIGSVAQLDESRAVALVRSRLRPVTVKR